MLRLDRNAYNNKDFDLAARLQQIAVDLDLSGDTEPLIALFGAANAGATLGPCFVRIENLENSVLLI